MATEGHGDIVREHTLSSHQFGVIAVAVTPDGQRTVSASWEKTLKLWDLVRGRELRTLSGHTGLVAGVAVTRIGSGQSLPRGT